MNYGRILRRAWDICWRWKGLFVLGLLSSLGYLAILPGFIPQTLQYARPGTSSAANWLNFGSCLGAILLLGQGLTWPLAQGALIVGVQQVEHGGLFHFRMAWRFGKTIYWTLLGIAILAASPLVATAMLLCCLTTILGIGLQTALQSPGGTFAFGAISLAFGAVLLIAAAAVYLIFSFASRAVILENMDWLAASRDGGAMLKKHLGPILLLSLVLLVTGLPALALVGAPILVVYLQPAAGLSSGLTVGLVMATIVPGLAACTFLQTYIPVAWTLAYRQMAGLENAPALPGSGGPPFHT